MSQERRCSRCGLLLAMEVDGELVIRTQKHQHMFSGGTLRTVCSRCGLLQVVKPAASPAGAARERITG